MNWNFCLFDDILCYAQIVTAFWLLTVQYIVIAVYVSVEVFNFGSFHDPDRAFNFHKGNELKLWFIWIFLIWCRFSVFAIIFVVAVFIWIFSLRYMKFLLVLFLMMISWSLCMFDGSIFSVKLYGPLMKLFVVIYMIIDWLVFLWRCSQTIWGTSLSQWLPNANLVKTGPRLPLSLTWRSSKWPILKRTLLL